VSATVAALPLTLSEAAFQTTVIDFALLRRWHVVHYRPALDRPQRQGQTKHWATPLQGHPGAPDLLLARSGVALNVELKSQRGRLSPMQREWSAELGASYRCWRPSDWPAIVEELW
jgi:hypothetical protein